MSAWHPPWPGFEGEGSLVLPLPRSEFSELAEHCEVDQLRLQRKREFHATLLDRELGARAQAHVGASQLSARFASLDWQWQRLDERWLLGESKDGVLSHSVVELIRMPAMAAFRRAVAQLLGATIPEAPAHVTLYIGGSGRGIGLASQAEFEHLRLRRL